MLEFVVRFFFFKQKTADEMRISDWSSDVCSSDLDRRMLALTFDDGPDAEWTPKILKVLESTRTPATFFVIGENALEHPGLLQRIVADGDEIGNHTYDHPNLATWSEEPTRLQLNATQRLVQAYTGRGMRDRKSTRLNSSH